METLTPRQEAIFKFISNFLEKQRIPPTVREIQGHFGFESTNAVAEHLAQLERKGYLKRRPGISRGIELASQSRCFHPDVISVPLVGQIAAGTPTLAEENIEGFFHLDKTLISARGRPAASFGGHGDGHFLLKVRGDSMKGAGIYNGDLVLVKKQERAESGEIVAAYFGGEATVKYFWLKRKSVELRPANSAYSPIRITQENHPDFRVLGKVKAVVRVL